jgi:lipopolysaccharide export system permease protein
MLIPSTLPYTLPATTLFATCVVYGRLAHDNEILALKAAGIHLWHVIWPAVLLGLLTSGLTLFLYVDVIPSTHHKLRTVFIEDVEEFLYSQLKREGCIQHSKINYTIYVQRVQGRKLMEALFMRRDPKDQRYDIIAWAREAEMRVNMKKKEIEVDMNNCYIISANDDGGFVQERIWPVELPPDITDATKKSSARAMTLMEIFDKIVELEETKKRFQEDVAAHQAVLNGVRAPINYEEHVRNLVQKIRHLDTQLRFLVTELHMRPALSLGCLCFVLVGCPVGIWFSRSDYLSAFITCFLPIVVIYYPLILCGINLCKLGRLSPWIGLWSANVLMAIIAALLFRRLLKN